MKKTRQLCHSMKTADARPVIPQRRHVGCDEMRGILAWLQTAPPGTRATIHISDPTALHVLRDADHVGDELVAPDRYELTRLNEPPLPSFDGDEFTELFDELSEEGA